MSVKLEAIQPGLTAREKVELCTLAAETCHGCEGRNKGLPFMLEYLMNIHKMGHLSIFEHARYCMYGGLSPVNEPGYRQACEMQSMNARYVIETFHEENPVTKKQEPSVTDYAYDALNFNQKLYHASATFLIECSRSCSHQLVRHRMGSYSQQSQRHVRIEAGSDWYVTPPSIAADTAASYSYEVYHEKAKRIYNALRLRGIKLEDARFILPNSTKTKILVTMTYEWWLHFIKLRATKAAQWEIRAIAEEIKALLLEQDTEIFDEALKL